MRGELLEQFLEAASLHRELFAHNAIDRVELLLWRQAVDRCLLNVRRDLSTQAGDAHHVELVQVRTEDGEKLHSLEQWRTRIHSLLQHAPVEREPAQLAVDEQRALRCHFLHRGTIPERSYRRYSARTGLLSRVSHGRPASTPEHGRFDRLIGAISAQPYSILDMRSPP